MTEQLPDVWASRDYPVLVEVTRHVDQAKEAPTIARVVTATGLDEEEVRLAARALEGRGLVELDGGIPAR